MRQLLITYDLNRKGQAYPALYEAIKSLGVWWHYLDSTWIVRTSSTIDAVTNKIRSVIDANDHFIVIDITGDSMNGWLPKDAWDWLQARVA
jgi:hypothetical protein